MLNGNAPKMVSSYELTKNLLDESVPDPEDFKGKVYPAEDVESDTRQLDAFEHTPDYKDIEDQSDSKLLERTFMELSELGDWFGEEEAYEDDPDYLALITFPTAKIDDDFNHVDVVGMIKNETTGHEIIPFAIDLTFNTDNEDMHKKFKWRHAYGKKETAPDGVSEFGHTIIEKDSNGSDVLKTYPLPLKDRYGLKIPGFASTKYYEDKNNPWDPMREKGRIYLMPRFIVGYSTDITEVLSGGMPTEEYRKKYGEQAYQSRKLEYKNAERRAKWCTLLECARQASDIRSMLENLSDEETKFMSKEELEQAKKQIAAMDAYFAKAIEVATEKAKNNPEEMAAKEYVNRDTVCQAIIFHSYDTYIGKNW